ncbi:hypothetical protein LJK88_38300 [Paenibacillus sp. P26]|nr:hypothetical protein LJK88_38300 [Paenibacillus sp. P26]UUZ93219.1 hypothetical protein LJK87_50005 [Paenibacillus sp. P25]
MDLNRLKEELEKVKADFQTVVAQIAYFQNLQQQLAGAHDVLTKLIQEAEGVELKADAPETPANE